MTAIRSKSVSHKLKRAIVFRGWRRHISGKEKWFAQQTKKLSLTEFAFQD